MSDSESQYALTTKFRPAPSCTPGTFDQLLQSQSFIFRNHPFPAAGISRTACYPSQFLKSYQAQKTAEALLPPIAPLVCPSGFSEAVIDYAPEVPAGYLACCPSGYSLQGPAPPWPGTRPAFGALCISSIRTLTVTQYESDKVLSTSVFVGTAGDNAFALPLEGYITPLISIEDTTRTRDPPDSGRPTSLTATPSASATTNGIPTSSADISNQNAATGNGLSTGEIAAIAIASVGFSLIALGFIIYFVRKCVIRRQAGDREASESRQHFAHPPPSSWI